MYKDGYKEVRNEKQDFDQREREREKGESQID